MQGEVPKDDLIFGGVVLAIALACVLAAGIVFNRWKNARFARVWKPLQPIIGGTVVEDGGGAATSWLTGTYRGRRVAASITPGRNRYEHDTGFRYNYFDVTWLDVPGAVAWTHRDHPEAARIVAALGQAEARYDPSAQTLTIIQEMGDEWVPSPAHFEAMLNALVRLAEIHAAK
ncbi:MAG: hypothetical protein R2729_24125 [Bryobacteraceae bacterium]